MLSVIMLSVIVIYSECYLCCVSSMLSVLMLSVANKPILLSVVRLNVVMLSVNMLSVIVIYTECHLC
jgi:hypothetical protein